MSECLESLLTREQRHDAEAADAAMARAAAHYSKQARLAQVAYRRSPMFIADQIPDSERICTVNLHGVVHTVAFEADEGRVWVDCICIANVWHVAEEWLSDAARLALDAQLAAEFAAERDQ